jgi:hypothetical protein
MKMSCDSYPQKLEVISEWTAGGENFRLVDLGAGPMQLQIKRHGAWVPESQQYIHSILCSRISCLSNASNEAHRESVSSSTLLAASVEWWESFRNTGMTVEEHLARPTHQCPNSCDRKLAEAVAMYVSANKTA